MATASLDCTAALWDVKTLKPIKTFTTNIPVRAVSISPHNDHIILAGGQDAKVTKQNEKKKSFFCKNTQKDVATKRMGSDNSQFAVRFYHKVFGDLIGTVKVGFICVVERRGSI
jgi:WD40 repeat protein